MAQLLTSTFENFHPIDRTPPIKKREYKAFCSSMQCAGVCGGNVRYKRIYEVKKSDVFCPHCNCALFWTTENKVK